MLLKRLGGFFLIKEDELPQVGYFLLFFFLIGAGLALGRGTTDALFFKRYGIQYLPVMYLILAGLLMTVTMVYAAFADRLPAERLFKVFLVSGFFLLLGHWALISFSVTEAAFPAYFLLYEVTSDLLVLHFSLYVNQNFETLQAKRLLPLVFGGAQLGTIAGGVFLALTAPLVGVPNILLIWSGLIVAALAAMLVHHRRHGVSPYFRPGRKSAGEFRQCIGQITHGLKFAKQSDLVRYSSLALFFTAIMFYILSYSVNRVYAETFTTEESLTAFFGILSAATSALALLIQIFLTNKLLHRFGVRTVNLIFPITSIVSYGLLILSFSLPAAIFASVNKDALMKAFRNPVRNLLFNALPNYMQGRARAMAAGLVLPVALALAGGILVLAQTYQVPIYFLLAGLGASLLYLYFNTKTNRAYVSGMISVLREKLFLPDQPLDVMYKSAGDELLRELRRGVQQPDDEISVAYAKKLVALFFHHSAEIILPRHETAGHAARDQLIKLLMPFNPPPLADYLWKQLERADDHLKATILEWFFERRDERAVNLVETALASPNPRLAAVGIYGAYRFSLRRLYTGADRRWRELLTSGEMSDNAAGLELLARQPETRYQPQLLALLQHANARVRYMALDALTHWPETVIPELSAVLENLSRDPDAKVRCCCVTCYRLLPDAARVRLLQAAVEDTHAGVRQAAAGQISHENGRADTYLCEWILQNSGSTRAQEAALRVLLQHRPPRDVLERIALGKAEDARALALALGLLKGTAMPRESALELMEYVLEERLRQTIDLSLQAIEHVENPAAIGSIRAGLQSGDRRCMANAAEAVRHLDNKKLAAVLGGLLDSVGPAGKMAADQTHRFQDIKDMLSWCRAGKDPWLRSCAEHAMSAAR